MAVPDQLKAVRELLACRQSALSAGDLDAAFQRAHRSTIIKHLDTLEGLGVLVAYEATGGEERRWGLRA